MSVRNLLLIGVLLAAASIGCTKSPTQPGEGSVSITVTTTTTTTTVIPPVGAGAIGTSPGGIGLAWATVYTFSLPPRRQAACHRTPLRGILAMVRWALEVSLHTCT